MNIRQYWADVLAQNAHALRSYFAPGAWIRWHNTNEQFTVEEFIHANCEYPGNWDGEIVQMICTDSYFITATHVHTKDQTLHFHVTSFIRMENGKIASIDEYWGDDGPAPQWRQELHIGTPINEGEKYGTDPSGICGRTGHQ